MSESHDLDPIETREWLDSVEDVIDRDGADRAHFLLDKAVATARAKRGEPAVRRDHRLSEHHPRGPAGALSRRRRARVAHPHHQPLERHGDRGAAQQGLQRVRRAYRLLRLVGGALRHRAQPLLAHPHREARRRPRLLPGPCGAGHLRALVHGGPAHRGAARQFPLRDRRQGPELLPAPVADARLLAVPDRLDGPRAADGDLPGAVHEIHAQPRPDRHGRPQGLGLPRRRRDGRAREPRRHRPRGARGPRQPDLRGQLQPAAPRRPGARQRQDHPGARGHLPRRRLERDQADLGLGLGPAARQGRDRACCAG